MPQRYEKIVRRKAEKYSIPEHLLTGVVELETTYRKRIHRTAEYCLVFIGFIKCNVFRKPIKNYTIGICQVGLANIFRHNGFDHYPHLGYVYFKPRYLKCTLKAMTYQGSIEIGAWLLKEFFEREIIDEPEETLYRRIGMRYNGTYTYGILLERLCRKYSDCDFERTEAVLF